MILAVTGMTAAPFRRLLGAIENLETMVDEDFVVQYGTGEPPVTPRGDWFSVTSRREMSALMRSARVIVSHAGAGSVGDALRTGKRPIVVPRRHPLREHVDDHQVAFARRLRDAGLVALVEDVNDLRDAIRDREMAAAAPFVHHDTLAQALAADIRRGRPDLAKRGK